MRLSIFLSFTCTLLFQYCRITLFFREYPNCLLDDDLNKHLAFGISCHNMGDIFEFTEFTAINKQERFNYLIPIDSLSLTFFGRQKNTSTYTTLFANTHILNAATHIANFISDYLFATSFFQPIRNYNNTQTLKFYSWLNENLYHNIVTSLAYTACDPELQNLNLGSIKETTLYAPITLKNLSIVTQQDQTKTLYQNYAESALVVALNSYV